MQHHGPSGAAAGSGPHILGVGSTPFGPEAPGSFRSMLADAIDAALQDAGIDATAIDEIHHANFTGALTDTQNHQAPLVADLVGGGVPTIRHENACASGGFAMWSAVRAIRSGAAEVVLVTGVEHLSPLSTGEVTTAFAMAADELYEIRNGLTFPGAYALMARSYISTYPGSDHREALSAIAVKNHAHASVNPLAHFQSTVDLQTAIEAPMVADPLNLYDSCPISDGAAAVVLAAPSAVPVGEAGAADVRIRGRAQPRTTSPSRHDGPSMRPQRPRMPQNGRSPMRGCRMRMWTSWRCMIASRSRRCWRSNPWASTRPVRRWVRPSAKRRPRLDGSRRTSPVV